MHAGVGSRTSCLGGAGVGLKSLHAGESHAVSHQDAGGLSVVDAKPGLYAQEGGDGERTDAPSRSAGRQDVVGAGSVVAEDLCRVFSDEEGTIVTQTCLGCGRVSEVNG